MDGLEKLTEDGELGMSEELLVESTGIVTALVVAWNIDLERISFVKAGQEDVT